MDKIENLRLELLEFLKNRYKNEPRFLNGILK